MNGKIDLHIHSSKSSDGDFSPSEIIEMAKQSEMRAISISDHDTLAAYPEAVDQGEKSGVEVIPSIELTTLFDTREFHLLVPFVNWEKEAVNEILRRASDIRRQEAQERVSKLQEIGFDISWMEIMEKTKSDFPLGVSIAQVLLEKAAKEKDPALQPYLEGKNRIFAPYLFYRDYFMEGKPAFVPKKNIPLLEVLEVIPQSGGIPVLAHPGAYFQKAQEEDLAVLKDKGLVGIEIYTTYHTEEQVEFYKKQAEILDLVPTAGSDFHGKIKPHIPFGAVKEGEYWMVEKLRERRR